MIYSLLKSWAVNFGVEEYLNVSSSIPLVELTGQLEAKITSVLSLKFCLQWQSKGMLCLDDGMEAPSA